MTQTTRPYLETFRADTEALFKALMRHTGMTKSAIGVIVGGARQYLDGVRGNDGFRVSTHDRALENFSAVWPPDLPWPEGVPRPDPATAMSRAEKPIEHAAVETVRGKAASLRETSSETATA